MRKLQQYFIYKISTKHLKRKNYKIELSIDEARKSGEIVSIGDSQMLRSLRKLKNINISQEEIDNLILEKKRIKKKKSSEENYQRLIEIEKQLDNVLFVPEIISILVEDLDHYKYIGLHGFIVNDVRYKRLLCGSGQARRNNSVWIAEEYEKPLKEILNNNRKDIEIVPAKFNAYFALSSSAGLEVSEPYFCVVKDLEVIRNETVDFIEEVDGGDDVVSERTMPITFNLWDGQGIISPKQARKWADELELDYVPSTFIIRSNFIKGMLAVIDFHEYSEEIGEHYITDIWGNKVNIRDMDIVLTQSQFKLWNAYDSVSDYIRHFRSNELSWSVTRVSPKIENTHCFMNYQFLQVLDLNQEQIEELCSQSVTFFEKVTNYEVSHTLLYLLGKHTESYDSDIFSKISDNVAKALILNNDLIKDPYIKNSIIHSLNKKIKESYIGNLIVDGHYTMMVADPYAFLEYIFGREAKGLLNRDEHYSEYWINKKEEKITGLRAPLTWRSEVNILNLKNNQELKHWYKYLNNCVIYNIFGNDCLIHGGSDFDGDIVCLTNNKQIMEGAYRDLGYASLPPVHYETKKPDKTKIDEDTLWEWDIKGFNSRVGFVTNCATSAFSLLPMFEEGSPEYLETINRLKRFRKEQGSVIDATKGLIIKPFPMHWTKWKRLKEDMSEEEIKDINFHNRVVINKRPLFMRYLYSSYNKQYLDFNRRYNIDSRMRFGKKIQELMEEFYSGKQLTIEENKLVEEYLRYIPFIQTKCLMNNISSYMERKIKELKEVIKSNICSDNVKILKDNSIETDKELFKLIYDLYKRYKNEKRNFMNVKEDGESTKRKTIEQFNKYIRQEAYKINSDGRLLSNMAIDICYVLHPGDNKSFAWNIFGNEIVDNILNNKQETCFIPFKNNNGEIEYLGDKYSLYPINVQEKEIVEYDYL